jgi:hypothetical protein
MFSMRLNKLMTPTSIPDEWIPPFVKGGLGGISMADGHAHRVKSLSVPLYERGKTCLSATVAISTAYTHKAS